MSAEKYSKIAGASKATATRDLADLLSKGLLRVEGIGKATRYHHPKHTQGLHGI